MEEQSENGKKSVGRKKGKDNKERDFIYVKKSIVEAHGGWDAMREKIYRFLGQND